MNPPPPPPLAGAPQTTATSKRPTPTAINLELQKLKSQQKFLEAAQKTLDFQRKYPNDDIAAALVTEANNIRDDLQEKLSVYAQQSHADLLELQSLLREFKGTMLGPQALEKFDNKQYRDQILLIDRRFRDMNMANETELTTLRVQYAAIESTMPAADVFLQEYHSTRWTSRRQHHQSPVRKGPVSRADNADVQRFLDYLAQHNGHSGGWSDEEHNLFVKLKRKYRDNMERITDSFRSIVVGWYR